MAKSCATHVGECQVCGSTQKLPNGKLSLHGYEVAGYGFFNGVCMGAKHLPFEQSKDLVEKAIKSAQERARYFRKMASERLAMRDPSKVWHTVYVSDNRKRTRGSYRLVEGRIELRDNRYIPSRPDVCFVPNNGGHAVTLNETTVEMAVIALNAVEAKRLESIALQADTYVRWQKERIKNWQVKELTPVADTAPKYTAEELELFARGAELVKRRNRYDGRYQGWWYNRKYLGRTVEQALKALNELQTTHAST